MLLAALLGNDIPPRVAAGPSRYGIQMCALGALLMSAAMSITTSHCSSLTGMSVRSASHTSAPRHAVCSDSALKLIARSKVATCALLFTTKQGVLVQCHLSLH